MIDNFKYSFGLLKRIGILEIVNLKNSQIFYYSIIQKEREEINTIFHKKITQPINDFKFIDKNTPLIITNLGSGIVYSETNSIIKDNIDDYFYTKYKSKNGTTTYSFSRRNKINDIINLCKINNVFIVDVYIGALCVNILFGKVFSTNNIHIADVIFSYNDVDFIGFSKTELSLKNQLKIDNKETSALEFLSFSIGINYFYPSNKISNSNNNAVKQSKSNYKYKRQFDLISSIGSTLIILLIIINFSISSVVKSKSKDLTKSMSNTSNYKNEFNILSNERNKKLELIKIAGFLNPNYLSFYLNEIGKKVPKEIIIDRISILPIKKNINSNEQIIISDQKIKISGKTYNNNSFNEFLNSLKYFKWVKKIRIISYENNEKSKSYFKLLIYLK